MACFACTVRVECDEFRQRTGSDHGVWAGRLQKRKDKETIEEDDD